MNDAICRIERGPYGAQFTLAVPDDSQEIHYQLETLVTSRPKALLPAFRQISANGARYAYPVTGLASLSELTVQKRLTRKQASAIVRQIREATLDLQDHLLSSEQVLLHPDCLFVRQPGWDIQVVYQPFLPLLEPFGEQELLDWLAKSAIRIPYLRQRWKKAQLPDQFKDSRTPVPEPPSRHKSDEQEDQPSMGHSRAVSLGLAIIQLLVLIMTLLTLWQPLGWPLSMEAINRPLIAFFALTIPTQAFLLIYSKAQNNSHTAPSDRPSSQAEHEDAETNSITLGARLKTLAASLNPKQALSNIRASINEQTEQSEASLGRVREMPTELLNSKQALFRLAILSEGMIGTAEETAGQRAFILTEEFVVGRDYRLVDLCLTGYAVGRRHARISRKGATFFITDLGSKNGTRLNGERLNKMVEYRLPDRCQIQFADRPFYFEAEELMDPLSDPVAC